MLALTSRGRPRGKSRALAPSERVAARRSWPLRQHLPQLPPLPPAIAAQQLGNAPPQTGLRSVGGLAVPEERFRTCKGTAALPGLESMNRPFRAPERSASGAVLLVTGSSQAGLVGHREGDVSAGAQSLTAPSVPAETENALLT
ncbi:hypothetical protein J1605_021100 [Eschrichtius robustus]|uniref:Uncharacterized protein n=1 Tax=Eschrichtius robustus TaxID=9764 RepID=A0AB34HDV0_ESCRO|nr:hypothetical protein J1605_021100 [Eschrichtius robustus]